VKRAGIPSIYLLGIAGAAGTAAAFFWIGPAGLVIAGVVAVLALVWRYDNWSGSCFMLSVLVLIVLAVLILLLVLLALPR
jgi:hypothetical protein